MELSQIWFIIRYPNNFVNTRSHITNMAQFNSPKLITYTYREAPYHLHVACSFVLLLNPDITRRKQGLGLALWYLALLSIMGLRNLSVFC